MSVGYVLNVNGMPAQTGANAGFCKGLQITLKNSMKYRAEFTTAGGMPPNAINGLARWCTIAERCLPKAKMEWVWVGDPMLCWFCDQVKSPQFV